jgi:N-acetylglucosamine kinase-like BadF-type ATPase
VTGRRCVVAVDGGNTKTIAVVASAPVDGGEPEVLGVGHGLCADIYGAASPSAALDEVEAAVGHALAQAERTTSDIAASAFGLAGADWPEDFALLDRELTERFTLTDAPIVVNDALGALRSGSPDWSGVAVVAGTYNAIGARRADGNTWHIGFWPDGAGGRDLARDALKAVYRAELDLGPGTRLVERALERYGARDGIELLHEFTRRGGLQLADQDQFAPIVLDTADAGDPVARDIVVSKARLLGRQARVCADRAELPLDGARIVLTGRVMDHPSPLIADTVMAELPGAVAVRHGAPPVVGALLLALDRLGVAVDGDAAALAAALHPERRSPRWVGSPSKA